MSDQKNERRALRRVDTQPVPMSPLAQVFLENKVGPQNAYRIQFSTPVVGPKELPDFPYVTSKIEFAAVVYTAVVHAESLQQASTRVWAYWPKAVLLEAEEGVSAFRTEDTHLTSHQFGSVRVVTKDTWLDALKRLGRRS